MVGLFVRVGVILLGLIVFGRTSQKCPYKTLSMCRCTQNATKYVVDCSNTGLSSVPRGIPARVTHLFLDYNHLKYLRNEYFPAFKKQLKVLSIKDNQMMRIDAGVFQHMPNIQELVLYNYSLEHENSLPESLFQPLSKSLKMLDIRMNILNRKLYLVNYPTSIGKLYNLRDLKMDCLRNKSLPFEYANLKQLKT